jgi:hypothetical protein
VKYFPLSLTIPPFQFVEDGKEPVGINLAAAAWWSVQQARVEAVEDVAPVGACRHAGECVIGRAALVVGQAGVEFVFGRIVHDKIRMRSFEVMKAVVPITMVMWNLISMFISSGC